MTVKNKVIAVLALVVAFVGGMAASTVMGAKTVAAGTNTPRMVGQGQQVTVERIINPSVSDEDIALLRQDLRAKKMQVIGQNMSLSDPEAEKFWPVYNHYVADLREVNDRKYALLKQYAEMWSTMTDDQALIYIRDWLETDAQVQALRLKYVPTVSQVLPGRKAATFFQLDRRLNMIIDLQLFSQIPLAHAKLQDPE
jgi:hypothetical protein